MIDPNQLEKAMTQALQNVGMSGRGDPGRALGSRLIYRAMAAADVLDCDCKACHYLRQANEAYWPPDQDKALVPSPFAGEG